MDIIYLIEDYIDSFSYHSSDVTWCETHYTQSEYIVEFWNTLSSVFIALTGLYGLYFSNSKTKQFYVLLTMIGIASMYFHATLSFAGQLFDELGITLIMLLANFVLYKDDKIGKNIVCAFGLIQIIIQFTYSEYNRFILFLYAILFINKFWQMILSENRITRLYANVAFGLFIMSGICWIFDFYACNSFFNFHALWHIFIALTAYFTIETCFINFEHNSNIHVNSNLSDLYWSDFYES